MLAGETGRDTVSAGWNGPDPRERSIAGAVPCSVLESDSDSKKKHVDFGGIRDL